MIEPCRVKSADRVLDLLELLAGTGRPMSHSEISRRIHVPKGSLTALLRNLVHRGYVDLSGDSSHFQLGQAAYALGWHGARSRDLVRAANPWLQRVVDVTGESAGLSVLRGAIAERVAAVQSGGAVLYSLHVGVLQPLYASSAGKILLAWMPPPQREQYLATVEFEPRTERTLRSPAVLRRQLETIREEGVAWSRGEFTAGIAGLAAPILDVHGRAIGAVGIAWPEARFEEANKNTLVKALRAAAHGIASDIESEFGESTSGTSTGQPASHDGRRRRP